VGAADTEPKAAALPTSGISLDTSKEWLDVGRDLNPSERVGAKPAKTGAVGSVVDITFSRTTGRSGDLRITAVVAEILR
jgi:hypothetical protein